MRANEFLSLNGSRIRHYSHVQQVLHELAPLRSNRQATVDYFNQHLSADIRLKNYLLQKQLYEQGNAMQVEVPFFESLENEIPSNIAMTVRDELFEVIKEDASYGYLFYLLGTEQNARHNAQPIDCMPKEERILEALRIQRDDYPKKDLGDYLDDDFNYEEYDRLVKDHIYGDNSEMLLRHFNFGYEIFDQLRIHRHKVSDVRLYLQGLAFENEIEKTEILKFVCRMAQSLFGEDAPLGRCIKELVRHFGLVNNDGVSTVHKTNSKVFLSQQRGCKINFIRVINSLYELGYFKDEQQNAISKIEVMRALGIAVNVDLSDYDKDLSRSLSDSTALDKHLKIFNEMKDKMESIFNSK